jgi:hypothetical protein
VSIALALMSGCQTLDVRDVNPLPWKDKEGQPDTHISKMVTSWKNVTVHQPGKPAMRGFGGRIYFYNRDGQAIESPGHLVVYVYDDQTRQDRPVRRYVFTPEQLQQHFSTTVIGPSYSIWLPWDPDGGPRKDLVLVPTFVPEKGSVVVSEAIKQRLPGPQTTSLATAASPPPGQVQSAAYLPGRSDSQRAEKTAPVGMESSAGSHTQELAAGIRETTIPMTPNVRQQAAQVPSRPSSEKEPSLPPTQTAQPPAAAPPQAWWPAGVPMGGRPFAGPFGSSSLPPAGVAGSAANPPTTSRPSDGMPTAGLSARRAAAGEPLPTHFEPQLPPDPKEPTVRRPFGLPLWPPGREG